MSSESGKKGAEGALASAQRLLDWAEERLLGPYEECWDCLGTGKDYDDAGRTYSCTPCDGTGKVIRARYAEAERMLTPEERSRVELSLCAYDHVTRGRGGGDSTG